VGIHAEREGKARRDRAHPARGVDLPQPIGLVFLELAQQQRNHFVTLQHSGFGNFGGQEAPGILDSTGKHGDDERDRDRGHVECALGQKIDDTGATNDAGEHQRAHWHGWQEDCRCRHQHREHCPELELRLRIGKEAEAGDRDHPGQRIGDRPDGLHLHFGLRQAAAVGIGQRLVDALAVDYGRGKDKQPGADAGEVNFGEEYPGSGYRADALDQQARHHCVGKAGILHAAQPRPALGLRIG